jgi:hypothetical protein
MDSSELSAGYEEMSKDAEREAEALEWCEALVGDAFSDSDGGTADPSARSDVLGRDDTSMEG